MGQPALHRGRAATPVRPRRRGVRPDRIPDPGGRPQLRRRGQPVHRRGAGQPGAQDAQRVRGAGPAPGTRQLEGHRRDRDRLARRRDLRPRGRERGRLGARPRGGKGAVRPQEGKEGMGGLPLRRGPRGADHGAQAALHLRQDAEEGPRQSAPGRGQRAGRGRPRIACRRELLGAGAVAGPQRPRRRLERPPRLGEGIGVGQPARRDGPPGELLHTAAPDGAGRPRPADVQRPADRCARGSLPRRQPLRAARTRARLLVERDVGRPGRHRHLRRAAVRAGRRPAHPRLPALPVPRPVSPVRGPGTPQLVDPEPRGPDATRQRDAEDAAHQARPRHPSRDGSRASPTPSPSCA